MAIGERDVLLVVDIQNDFCPGGSLAVPRGDEIVPLINSLAAKFPHVVLTQDWHPRGHLSFSSSHAGKQPFETIDVAYGRQILWPDHCVQGSSGAAFHADLSIAMPSNWKTSLGRDLEGAEIMLRTLCGKPSIVRAARR